MSPHSEIVQAMGMPSGFEWLVILIIALMLFGNKLPSVMRNLGGSVREFKKGMDVGDEKPASTAPPSAPEGAVSRDAAAAPAPAAHAEAKPAVPPVVGQK